jgi:excinuclease ABC subunit B
LKEARAYVEPETPILAADPIVQYMNADALKKLIEETKSRMKKAASDLDFIEAARLRDEMYALEKKLKGN